MTFNIQPTDLTSTELNDNTTVRVSGWGLTADGKPKKN